MLSTVLGQKVTKFNFQIILKDYVNPKSKSASQSAPDEPEKQLEMPRAVHSAHSIEDETRSCWA